MKLHGFHGEVSNLRVVEESQPADVSSNVRAGSDMDLVAMARWALYALKHNPRPHLDYECRFSLNLLNYPPCPGPDDHDPITIGDTDNRMDWEFGYMKDMTGDTSADDVARGIRKRVLGYLREDGNCWATVGMGSSLPGVWVVAWTTGKLLISLCEDYRRTHGRNLRSQCRKMFDALRARADWVDGRAYYAGGNSFWNENGWAITDGSPYHPAMVLEAVVRYYEVFHDEEALDFAVAFAEGEMANDQWHNWILRNPENLTPEQKKQRDMYTGIPEFPSPPPDIDLSVRADGSFDHHSHMRGHQGWGMAHLAAITREPRLIAWSKRLLDFFLSRGTDYGWIPESMTVPARSETCAVSDVINIAEWVAKCGYPEYWDTIERFVRNYIREAQFFCTPEYEKLYRSLHPEDEGEKGLAMARELQGGFQGAMGVTDRVWTGTEMDMMGCCVPEGMRAIHTAWINTVTDEPDGVQVNMCFDRDAPEAKVISSLPYEGRMKVEAKISSDFYLRPPAWAPHDRVHLYRNEMAVPTVWRQNAYIFAENVENGEVLTMTYPLLSFVQKQTVKNALGEADRYIAVTWLGNTVKKVEPVGEKLPLYQQVPRRLPQLSDID